MKVTHTHRGHCQFCLCVHAIDVETGRLAIHGYTVKGGRFLGNCPGSRHLSLHVERTHTDGIIAAYRQDEAGYKALADGYEAGTATPEQAWKGKPWADGKYWEGVYHHEPRPTPRNPKNVERVRTMIDWKDANDVEKARQLKESIERARRDQDNAKYHADLMQRYAAEIFDGKVPAYPNEAFDAGEWQVGDTVRVGGVKCGFDAVIEAIENKEYRTSGWCRASNVTNIPHAKVTEPAIPEKRAKGGRRHVIREARPARERWEPLRNIKRPPLALVEKLKKDGLL